MAAVRRSARLQDPDPNGRQVLADTMGWPRSKVDTWIVSPTVLPHLQLWHRLCVSGVRRYNEVIDMINCGYFYIGDGFEEDILLACLGEGQAASEEYEACDVKTASWTTTELWARTAWRIVNGNKASGLAFAMDIHVHPVACYAFAIDLLCLAFHSIAHRGVESCYEQLINGHTAATQDELITEAAETDLTLSLTTASEVGKTSTASEDNRSGSGTADDSEDGEVVINKKHAQKLQQAAELEDEITVARRRVDNWDDGMTEMHAPATWQDQAAIPTLPPGYKWQDVVHAEESARDPESVDQEKQLPMRGARISSSHSTDKVLLRGKQRETHAKDIVVAEQTPFERSGKATSDPRTTSLQESTSPVMSTSSDKGVMHARTSASAADSPSNSMELDHHSTFAESLKACGKTTPNKRKVSDIKLPLTPDSLPPSPALRRSPRGAWISSAESGSPDR